MRVRWMKSFARRLIASCLAAVLALGSWPVSGAAQAPAAARGAPAPKDAAALRELLQWRVYRGDKDVLKSWLYSGGRLTPEGREIHWALRREKDPARRQELLGTLAPDLDALRRKGAYTHERAADAERRLRLFDRQFGQIRADDDGSVSGGWAHGTKLTYLLQGAAADELPSSKNLTRVPLASGYEVREKNGKDDDPLARFNENGGVAFDRTIRDRQRLLRDGRPSSRYPIVPVTGRYNPEMFSYFAVSLASQREALEEDLLRERSQTLAELLGVAPHFTPDMFKREDVRKDLEAQARATTYRHHGRVYTLLEYVDGKFAWRRAYLKQAAERIAVYQDRVERLKAQFRRRPAIKPDQVKVLDADQRYVRRALQLVQLEKQLFAVRGQMEKLDPRAPDSELARKTLAAGPLGAGEQARYQARAQAVLGKLERLRETLESTRVMLSKAETSMNMDLPNAALKSSAEQLQRLGLRVSMYAQTPNSAYQAQAQTEQGNLFFTWGGQLFRNGYRWLAPRSDYARSMTELEERRGRFRDILGMLARGKEDEAMSAQIAMNPKAPLEAAAGLEPVPGARKLMASLQQDRDRLQAVMETNRWLDTAGTIFSTGATLAVAGPPTRGVLGLVFNPLKLLDEILKTRITGLGQFAQAADGARRTWAQSGAFWLARPALMVAHRGVVISHVILEHTSAQLQRLEPESKVFAAKHPHWLGRYVAGIPRRLGNAVQVQTGAVFQMGVIMGAQGLWDYGLALTTQSFVEPGGTIPFLPFWNRRSYTRFDGRYGGPTLWNRVLEARDAFGEGFKGGAWWYGSFHTEGPRPHHPIWQFWHWEPWHIALGFFHVNFAASWRGTRLAGLSEAMTQGVFQSSWTLGKRTFFPAAAAKAVDLTTFVAPRGFSGRFPWTAGFGRYVLQSGDHMLRFLLLAKGMDVLGRAHGEHLWRDEEDLDRRIKGAASVSTAWRHASWWFLLPSPAAQDIRAAQSYARAIAGLKQYEAAGRLAECYQPPDAEIPLLKHMEVPIALRLLGGKLYHFGGEEKGHFNTTPETNRLVLELVLPRMLTGSQKPVAPRDLNPLELYQLKEGRYANRAAAGEEAENAGRGVPLRGLELENGRRLSDDAAYRRFRMGEDVRLVLDTLLRRSLREDPGRTLRVLDDARLGREAAGVGRVTRRFRDEVVEALILDELLTGRELPSALHARLNTLSRPYRDSNLVSTPQAEALYAANMAVPAGSQEAADALAGMNERVREWTNQADQPHYTALLQTLRADAARLGEGPVRAALERLYDYVESREQRFNGFNEVGRVRAQAAEILLALRREYEEQPDPAVHDQALRALNALEAELARWARTRRDADPVTGRPAADGGRGFQEMAARLDGAVAAAEKALGPAASTPAGRRAVEGLRGAVQDVRSAPWVLRDAHRSPMTGWRDLQFAALLGGLGQVTLSGGRPVRFFQQLKTSGGKTLLLFEGFLPLIEVYAARQGREILALTVQSSLDAQGRLNFGAYRKPGSKVTFDLYEGLKGRIIDAKLRGDKVLDHFWILGDEMDGALLQAAQSRGQQQGKIARRSWIYEAVEREERDQETALSGARDSWWGRQGLIKTLHDGFLRERAFLARAGGREAVSRVLAEADAQSQAALRRGAPSAPRREADARAESFLLDGGGSPRARAAAARRRAAAQSRLEDLGRRLRETEDAILEAREALLAPARAQPPSRRRKPGWGELEQAREAWARRQADAAAAPEAAPAAPSLRRKPGWDALEKARSAREDKPAEELAQSGDRELAAQRLAALEARRARLEAELAPALAELKAARLQAGESSGRIGARLNAAAGGRRERGVVRDAERRVRNMLEAYDGDIISAVRRGGPGWQNRVGRLLRLRRRLVEAFTADEEPGHADYRELNARVGRFADRLLRGDAGVETVLERHNRLEREALRAQAERSDSAARGDEARLKALEDAAELDALEAARAERTAAHLEARRAAMEAELIPEAAIRRQLDQEQAALERETQLSLALLRHAQRPEVDQALRSRRAELEQPDTGSESGQASLELQTLFDRAHPALRRDGDRTVNQQAVWEFERAAGGSYGGWAFVKAPWLLARAWMGETSEADVAKAGLTRLSAARLAVHALRNPDMAPHERDALVTDLVFSVLFPRGLTGRGTSWMFGEAVNLLLGRFDDLASVRLDGGTGRVNVVMGGSWHANMNTGTLRYHQLRYGADLLLPYTHTAMSTIKDLTTSLEANVISVSGTAGRKIGEHFFEHRIDISGDPSRLPVKPGMLRVDGELLARTDAPSGARAEIEAAIGGRLDGPSDVPLSRLSPPVRGWLEGLNRAPRDGSAWVDADLLARADAPRGARAEIERVLGGRLGGRAEVPLSELSAPVRRWLRERGEALQDALSAPRLSLSPNASFAQALSGVVRALDARRDAGRVVLEPGEADAAPPAVRRALERYYAQARPRLPSDRRAAVEIDQVQGAEAQRWLGGLRAAQGRSALVTIVCPNTRVLRQVRKWLLRRGLAADEIAQVFSDAEFLRNNVSQANVERQMNLGALTSGRARVFLLDANFGRGLDLDFKGNGRFRGYTDFDMHLLGAELMSPQHLLQAMGRIDDGRILPGARRDYELPLDVSRVQDYQEFRDMVRDGGFFRELAADAGFQTFLNGRRMTWLLADQYLRAQAAAGSGPARLRHEQYVNTAWSWLRTRRQPAVESDQLRASGVGGDARAVHPLQPGLERLEIHARER